MEISDLSRLAKRFRTALEATDFDSSDGNLDEFPDQCCDGTSKLFGLYLFEEHGINSALIVGLRAEKLDDQNEVISDEIRHVWLVIQDIIVDLTADQFKSENQPPVIVAKESPWHGTWHFEREQEVDQDYCRRLKDSYWSSYRKLIASLNS